MNCMARDDMKYAKFDDMSCEFGIAFFGTRCEVIRGSGLGMISVK